MRSDSDPQRLAHHLSPSPEELVPGTRCQAASLRTWSSLGLAVLALALAARAVPSAEAASPKLPDTVLGLSNPDKPLPPSITGRSERITFKEVPANLGKWADLVNSDDVSHFYHARIVGVELVQHPDYQGNPQELVVLDLVMGQYEDGSPAIVRGEIGPLGGLLLTEYRNLVNAIDAGYQSTSRQGISLDLVERLVLLSNRNAEVDVWLFSYLRDRTGEGIESSIPWVRRISGEMREGLAHIGYNMSIRDALQESNAASMVAHAIPDTYREILEEENSFGWFAGVVTYNSYYLDVGFQEEAALVQISGPG